MLHLLCSRHCTKHFINIHSLFTLILQTKQNKKMKHKKGQVTCSRPYSQQWQSQDSNPGGDLGPASIYLTTREISVFPQYPVHTSIIMLTELLTFPTLLYISSRKVSCLKAETIFYLSLNV